MISFSIVEKNKQRIFDDYFTKKDKNGYRYNKNDKGFRLNKKGELESIILIYGENNIRFKHYFDPDWQKANFKHFFEHLIEIRYLEPCYNIVNKSKRT